MSRPSRPLQDVADIIAEEINRALIDLALDERLMTEKLPLIIDR